MLIAKGTENEIKDGKYNAVCFSIWDLGLQKSEFNGKETENHKIVIGFEFVNNGAQFVQSKEYTLSLGRKSNLRSDLESWLGRPFTDEELKNGFDVSKLKGLNCQIELKANSKGYLNIDSIYPAAVNTVKPTRSDEPPEWIRNKMSKGRYEVNNVSDTIPF